MQRFRPKRSHIQPNGMHITIAEHIATANWKCLFNVIVSVGWVELVAVTHLMTSILAGLVTVLVWQITPWPEWLVRSLSHCTLESGNNEIGQRAEWQGVNSWTWDYSHFMRLDETSEILALTDFIDFRDFFRVLWVFLRWTRSRGQSRSRRHSRSRGQSRSRRRSQRRSLSRSQGRSQSRSRRHSRSRSQSRSHSLRLWLSLKKTLKSGESVRFPTL